MHRLRRRGSSLRRSIRGLAPQPTLRGGVLGRGRFWTVFLAVLWPLCAGGGCRKEAKIGGGSASRVDGVLRVGLAGPLTGAQAQTGQDMRDGALLAIEEVNATGGVLGKKLELVARDDKADPKEAVSVARFFANDSQVVGVVGHLNSDCSLAAARVYHQAHMAMVTPVSTSDALTQKGYRSVFRIPIRNAVQGSAAAEFAIEQGFHKFAVVDDGGAYGEGIANAFVSAVQRGGGATIVLRDKFSKDDTDFRPLLQRIQKAGADAVYFGGMYPAGGLFLKQARQMGLKFAVFGGDGLYAPKLVELAGKAAEGTVVTFIAPLPRDPTKAHPFYRAFAKRFGHDPVVYAPLAYDAAKVLVEGIRRAGKVDRAAIVAALHDPEFRYRGVTGLIRFDKNGEGLDRKPFFYRVEGGKFVLVDQPKR